MAGNSTLFDSLVDSLVPDVVDELRDSLHEDFGVRAYNTHAVTRTWTSGQVGNGEFVDEEVELTPSPLIELWKGPAELRHDLEPCGLDESGYIIVREVSLTYNYQDLTGSGTDGAEFFIKVSEAHGQGQPDRYFTHYKPPYPDRIEDIGWWMFLRRVDVES